MAVQTSCPATHLDILKRDGSLTHRMDPSSLITAITAPPVLEQDYLHNFIPSYQKTYSALITRLWQWSCKRLSKATSPPLQLDLVPRKVVQNNDLVYWGFCLHLIFTPTDVLQIW